jgi:hypothetical protein
MNGMIKFHPAAIHEFAAQLFWRLAHRTGIIEATKAVITTAGEAVLEPSLVSEAMLAMKEFWRFAKLPDEHLRTFKRMAAAEAFHHVREHRPLLGQVIFDDVQTGRAPGVEKFVTPAEFALVRHAPLNIELSRPVPALGKLVIRSPLPAIVISQTPPDKHLALCRVADTTALDADLPLYLLIEASEHCGPDVYLLTGTFQIPVKDADQGRAWSRLVPNSARFYRQFIAQDAPGGDLRITTTWNPDTSVALST